RCCRRLIQFPVSDDDAVNLRRALGRQHLVPDIVDHPPGRAIKRIAEASAGWRQHTEPVAASERQNPDPAQRDRLTLGLEPSLAVACSRAAMDAPGLEPETVKTTDSEGRFIRA